MSTTNNRGHSTRVLGRVPVTVFLFLRISREDAHSMGMVGCGLQLDATGDYSWADTTVSISLENVQANIFLKTRKMDVHALPGLGDRIARIPILDMVEYIRLYPNILSFLERYRKNRFLRLGRRAFLDPWDLDSRDSFLLNMDDSEFESSFIQDPRGPPLASEVASGNGRHSPKLIRAPPGLPDPGVGSWI